ncbi:hypothetical protein A1O3_08539 [Capronia epimyces CBS 606.96]|uniref:Uncharacterized protein n=1 Tax=Capronia epimyces CBS 606.96 TaxID=1182542 RepID=W9XFP4_9EURO|nr:uncharacterized protein A1O3_08539 [Capronia epimyces CBS 606.96]EXJ79038.1 hypothetical protein A1O3_08539 [Capronia epimyces CBS 606.96]
MEREQKHFEFIDSTKSDKATRRLARSHAMKGKNAGKTLHRHRQSRLDLRGQQTATARVPNRRSAQENENRRTLAVQDSLDLTYPALSDKLLSVSFPVETTPQGLGLISQFFDTVVHALYPPQICRSLEQTRLYWLQVLFMDKTAYHCSLALMATLNAFFFGREAVPSKAIYHLGQAVSLVNQQLQTAEALSDSNLAVVNFLVVQELLREAQPEAEVHLRGLQKMIQLRGGLSQLGEDSPLAIKICKSDLDYALHYGTSPCFYRDRMSDVALALASEGLLMNRHLGDCRSRFDGIDPCLRQILLDVTNIASLFNMDYKMDPHTFQEVIVSLGSRLVRFHPLSGPPLEGRLESACHVGLITFVTTFFLQCGRRRFLKYGLVGQHLRQVIDRGLDKQDDDLMLWILFIGGTSVLADRDHAWLMPKIQRTLRSLSIETWAGLHQCLVLFPWVNSLHDEAAKALWDAAVGKGVGPCLHLDAD